MLAPGLERALRATSRSFYLSLRVLPAPLREPLSIGYVLARAADTIADTEAVATEQRRDLLASFASTLAHTDQASALADRVQASVRAPRADEAALLAELPAAFAAYAALTGRDRNETQRVLTTLAAGMSADLARFTGSLTALPDDDALMAYCYAAAGCVGEHWSLLLAHHVPALAVLASPRLLACGIGLGNGLQLVNVIRDAPRDLAMGRCYVPADLLRAYGLAPADLLDPASRRRAKPVMQVLMVRALRLLDEAWPYVAAIPSQFARLRLAVVWPQWIGFATLAALSRAEDPLDPAQVIKIPRRAVYALMAESGALVRSSRALHWAHRRKHAAVPQ
jgi:farnesyl-diphosphate farnesyltransferase